MFPYDFGKLRSAAATGISDLSEKISLISLFFA
jgi:hypothetical protein